MTRLLRRIRHGALAVGLLSVAAVLSGCETVVETSMRVNGDGAVRGVASVSFDGAIRDVLQGDAALLERLETTLAGRFGSLEVVEAGGRYRVEIDDHDGADLTGVQVDDVRTVDGVTTVSLTVAEPAALVAAIDAALADWPDGSAVRATARTTVTVAVTVEYPGRVTAHTGFAEVDTSTVRFAATLDQLTQPVRLDVSGTTEQPRTWIRWLVAGVVVVGVGVLVRRGRR